MSAFLPAAGFRYTDNGQLSYRGHAGEYWSSTQNGGNGYHLEFIDGSALPADNDPRSYGFSVRCVAELKMN